MNQSLRLPPANYMPEWRSAVFHLFTSSSIFTGNISYAGKNKRNTINALRFEANQCKRPEPAIYSKITKINQNIFIQNIARQQGVTGKMNRKKNPRDQRGTRESFETKKALSSKENQVLNFPIKKLVPGPGIEPGTHGFSVRCSTDWAIPAKWKIIHII